MPDPLLPLLSLLLLVQPAEPPANLVLVTVDTLRADRVGVYGRSPTLTPGLDSLAARGLLFEDVTSPVPLTLPSHATILTGEPVGRHGILLNRGVLPPGIPTLAERLRAGGYRTGAFVSGAPLLRGSGLERGFDEYDDHLSHVPPGTRYPAERTAAGTAPLAAAWITRAREPFFLWVHFWDPHAPYTPAPSVDIPGYEGEVRAADEGLRRVLDALSSRGLEGRTAILVTSDHGEALGGHGERTHGVFLYQETLRVPLVLKAPGIAPGVRKDAVGLGDIAPTFLALAGLPGPGLAGRDLRLPPEGGESREFPIESRHGLDRYGWAPLRGLRKGMWKYVGAPEPELYNLLGDPGEGRNLASARPAIAAGLAARLPLPAEPSAPPSGAGPVSSARREALAALGYAAVPAAPPAGPSPDPKSRAGLLDAIEEGQEALFSGDLERARRLLSGVVRDDPGNPAAWNDLGMALQGLARSGEAARAFRRAAALQPGDAAIWNNLGLSLASSGRPGEARAAYARSASLAEDFAAPLLNRAILEARQGDPGVAREWAERALRVDPGFAEARRFLESLTPSEEGTDRRSGASAP